MTSTLSSPGLINNHSDHEAAFKVVSMPDLPVINFFADGVGPKSYPFFGGGTSQDFIRLCKQMERTIEQEACKPDDVVMQDVKKSAVAAHKAKSSAITTAARAKAKARSEGRAPRREVSLDNA